MPDTDPAERDRRVQLAATSVPGDPITAALVQRLGTEQTIRLAFDDDAPAPDGIPIEGFAAWQERLVDSTRTTTVRDVYAACERHGISVSVPGDPDWPTALDDLSAPPLALFRQGDAGILTGVLEERIAFVGAKAETAYGRQITAETVATLAEEQRIIVAGASFGIDRVALQSALVAGGRPVVALAGGLDDPYPRLNADLIRRVAERGAVVSEAPPGVKPTRSRFLQRDRIVAALAGTTVLVEAGAHSSALHAAQAGRDLGRIVAAFPGPVTSPTSAGPHILIASGAGRLVTGAHDIRALIEEDPTGVLALAAERTQATPTPEDRRSQLRLITPERPEPPRYRGPDIGL